MIRVETIDNMPVWARPWRVDISSNLFSKQRLILWCDCEIVVQIVPVPYDDRIQRFLALFDSAYEAEVTTFYRLCSDIREINKKAMLDIFPLPRIDDILDNIPRGTERFSSGDVKDGLLCVEIHPDDRRS